MSEPACKATVLVTEDNEANRDLLSGLLTGEGYQVICAEDMRDEVKRGWWDGSLINELQRLLIGSPSELVGTGTNES